MAEDTLDLSGKTTAAEEPAPQKPGRKPAGGKSADKIYTRPDRAERRWEQDLRGRIERTIERLVEWLEGRGDDELATVFREDGGAMIGGLIALCRPLAWLRGPLVLALTVVEPLLAFGRLFRVVGSRWADRRARIAEERALVFEEPQDGDGTG